MEVLIDYYRQILASLGVHANASGQLIHNHGPIADTPFEVKERQMYLPSRPLLADPNFSKEDNIIFHPLSENVSRGGESDVLKAIRMLIEIQVTNYMGSLMIELTRMVAEKKSLRGKQASTLKELGDADAKFLKFVSDVVDAAELTGRNRLFKLFITRGGKLNDKKFNRVCIASFPVYEAAMNERNDDVFGVKLPRKKDRKRLISLIEAVVGEFAGEEAYYSHGSNSPVAPYLDALLMTYSQVVKQINHVVTTFKNRLPKDVFDDKGKVMEIDISEWDGALGEMYRLRDSIPPMPHNTGETEAKGASIQKSALVATDDEPEQVRRTTASAAAAPPHAQTAPAAPAQTNNPNLPPHVQAAAPSYAAAPVQETRKDEDAFSIESLTRRASERANAAVTVSYGNGQPMAAAPSYAPYGQAAPPSAAHPPHAAAPAYGATSYHQQAAHVAWRPSWARQVQYGS